MPIIESKYKAKHFYKNRHIATILPSVFRKIEVNYNRERITLSDGDFIDLDWLRQDNKRLVIISHGLEGHSHRHYVTASAKNLAENGWDVLAWNCRSCSGEMNLLPRLYSHIDAPDLAEVIDYAITKKYQEIALVGFSMGGAITLNYLTKLRQRHPTELIAAVAISAPIDVAASAERLEEKANSFYRNRFLKKMVKRIKLKALQFPELFNVADADNIRTFAEYDVRYTAPMNNCTTPAEFYERAGTKDFLDRIGHPTLLVVAQDDPFMSESCYPIAEAHANDTLFLEMPRHGGHTGFSEGRMRNSYMEHRILEFINNYS